MRGASTDLGPQIRNWLGSIPIATSLMVILNVAIAVITLPMSYADQISLSDFAICYKTCVSPQLQLYRIFTSAVTHGSAAHITVNMLTLLGLGPQVERKIGSLGFISLTFVYIVLSGLL